MKKVSILFASCLILLSDSCKKSNFAGPMSVSEVYTYTNQATTKCTEKLKNDNKEIVLVGFIHKLNVDSTSNCFDIFENSDVILSKRIQVIVTDNKEKIFSKISKQLGKVGENDFIKIKIKGTILGKPLYTNGACIMGTFITISDWNAISF